MKRWSRLRGPAIRVLGALLLPTLAHAAPIARGDLVALCAEAEDQAQCGRLVEARQLKSLSRIAERNGDELRVSLAPFGLSVFHDTVNIRGARTYAVWDYLENVDTLVLFTTVGERTGFLLVQRRTGDEYRVPSEPVMAPDDGHFVTADVCAQQCDNEVAVWRIAKDGVRKEAAWTPPPTWSDVSVTWRTAGAIVLEYSVAGESRPRSIEYRLDDPSWKKVPAK